MLWELKKDDVLLKHAKYLGLISISTGFKMIVYKSSLEVLTHSLGDFVLIIFQLNLLEIYDYICTVF